MLNIVKLANTMHVNRIKTEKYSKDIDLDRVRQDIVDNKLQAIRYAGADATKRTLISIVHEEIKDIPYKEMEKLLLRLADKNMDNPLIVEALSSNLNCDNKMIIFSVRHEDGIIYSKTLNRVVQGLEYLHYILSGVTVKIVNNYTECLDAETKFAHKRFVAILRKSTLALIKETLKELIQRK